VLIDAHQHFWRIGENDCAWPTPDLSAIHRDFGPKT
jgi:L-fuconolactonase